MSFCSLFHFDLFWVCTHKRTQPSDRDDTKWATQLALWRRKSATTTNFIISPDIRIYTFHMCRDDYSVLRKRAHSRSNFCTSDSWHSFTHMDICWHKYLQTMQQYSITKLTTPFSLSYQHTFHGLAIQNLHIHKHSDVQCIFIKVVCVIDALIFYYFFYLTMQKMRLKLFVSRLETNEWTFWNETSEIWKRQMNS